MERNEIPGQGSCRIESGFWNRYIGVIRNGVIPYQWDILNDRREDAEPSHAIDNFRIAAGEMEGAFYGQVFQDSDVYKWLEAVGNILMLERDPHLEEQADSLIDLIVKAQEPDGYLDTYFTIREPDKKWSDLLECHELYCAGHMIEGAIAYYQATGKEKIYRAACRLADYLTQIFGQEEGKMHGYPGHQEIELALLKLYEVSGEEQYLRLASYFLETRGTNRFFEEEFEKRGRTTFWNGAKIPEPNERYNHYPYSYYNQFHAPVRQQETAVGHAVRAMYMYTAMADLAAKTKDQELYRVCRRLWDDVTTKQMYLTGGIGATSSGEAFTQDYDLPNDTNYSETCASIGLIFFAHKMLQCETDSVYGDVMEQALYNTVLGGMNYEGNRFFYVNPLEAVPEVSKANPERHHVGTLRRKWFACACCPPNLARLIGSLWKYIYTVGESRVNVQLYIAGTAHLNTGGQTLSVIQKTEYPNDGKISFTIQGDGERDIEFALRIPGWAENWRFTINGEAVVPDQVEKGYAVFCRSWKQETTIQADFEMKAQFVGANPKIHYDLGRAAMTRGPLVYCLEEADNGPRLDELVLNTEAGIRETARPEWNGYVELEADAVRIKLPEGQDLYMPYRPVKEKVKVRAVPYYLWNNRGEGEMQVWMKAD